MKYPEINAKVFYFIGKYSFYSIGIIGIIRVVDLWSTLKSYDIISSSFSIIFNLSLAAFFGYMQKQEDIKEVNDSDIIKMDKILNDINKKEVNKK